MTNMFCGGDAYVLKPLSCNVDGSFDAVTNAEDLAILHNEPKRERSAYPLLLARGEYFSEVSPEDEPDYARLIRDSLFVLSSNTLSGILPFESLESVGRKIQTIDSSFAVPRIGQAPDRIHCLHGVDQLHPYRKITLARTSVPVRIGDGIIPFLYEKFLVSYSFWNCGQRCPTITPIHSHPLNYEVVYFVSHGPTTYVVEEEFEVVDQSGLPLVDEAGRLNPSLIEGADIRFDSLTVRATGKSTLMPRSEPIPLDPFDADLRLDRANIIRWTDGFFRPHRVTVHEGPGDETLYYAFNNYFGPTGRVFIYSSTGSIEPWSHGAWSSPH